MAPDQKIYRQIVDVLLKEHEFRDLPDVKKYSLKMFSCVWGLYAYIHRLGRAATILIDNGMEFEAVPITRVMLEYTIVLHWVIERGEKGVDALLANQSRRMKVWLDTTKSTELEVPPKIAQELLDIFI